METELRQVTIEEYWPLIVRNTEEFGQIAVAENPEFNKLASCIYQVLQETFVRDATEYGVGRWENILKISPESGDTLEDRKARILTHLNVKLPYTVRVLEQMLVGLLGEGKVNIDFINDESKLIVHTDRVSDSQLQTVTELLERVLPRNLVIEQYNHHFEVSWRDIDKYANCKTRADMDAVNPNYLDDITSDGWWVYPVPKLLRLGKTFAYGSGLTQAQRNKITHFITDAPLAYNNYNNGNHEWPYYAALGFWGMQKLVEFRVTENRAERASGMFSGDKSLRIYRGALGDCKDGEDMFNMCILDKDSVLHIAETLNDKRNYRIPKFLLGIHIDHQNDEEVLAAIDTIAAKGWTVTVQWNGTPTSGISLMDLDEIWCKVTESEYGEYTDENGKRCKLDWGHYVTDSSGYKLFSSLVEAEQHFKLTRIENNE